MRWNALRLVAPPPPPPPPPESMSLLSRMQEYSMPHVDGVRAMLGDSQDFIQQGSMIDLGLILGSSFSAILNSFVIDICRQLSASSPNAVSPTTIGLQDAPSNAIGCTSQTWKTWKQARDARVVTINYDLFVENVMNFLINAIFLFFAVKKVFEVVFKRNVLVKKQCPFYKEFVKGNATRCKECGSDIDSLPSVRGG